MWSYLATLLSVFTLVYMLVYVYIHTIYYRHGFSSLSPVKCFVSLAPTLEPLSN